MAHDFVEELARLKKPVWQILQSYLPDREPKDHYKMVKDYPSRQGKYLRPGLLLLSTALFGGNQKKALVLAAAVQASEEWLLIHDDIEDHSEYRRSLPNQPRPTLHRLYGDDLALNAGDALHILMWRILGDAVEQTGGKLGWQIFRKMNDILLTTTEGQFVELNWEQKKVVDINTKDYYGMIFKKSATYSIIGPLQLGAMAAGQTSSFTMNAIKHWATPLGYAFQIRDDLINLTQPSTTSGKEQGGDIVEGKRTLILTHLLQNCSALEKDYITAIYNKSRKEKTETEKQYVIELMNKYGSMDYAARIISNHCHEAEKEFNKFAKRLPDSLAKQHIKQAIGFVGSRVY